MGTDDRMLAVLGWMMGKKMKTSREWSHAFIVIASLSFARLQTSWVCFRSKNRSSSRRRVLPCFASYMAKLSSAISSAFGRGSCNSIVLSCLDLFLIS